MDRYSLTQYTDENGLPQNSVKNIVSDSKGFIWLATENGLVRFDGNNFYTFFKANTGISDNRIVGIQSSLTGNGQQGDRDFYACTDHREYIRIKNGRAVVDTMYPQHANKLPFIKKGFWATQVSLGLPSFLNTGSHPDHYIIPLSRYDGHFYVSDRRNITYYEHWKKVWQMSHPVNSFWGYFTMGEELCYFDGSRLITGVGVGGKSDMEIIGDIAQRRDYPASLKQAQIYWNPANDQAFLYLNESLYLLKKDTNNSITTRLVLKDFDLKVRDIQSVYYDSSMQTLFLGSLTEGLFMMQKQAFRPATIPVNDGENVFYAQTVYGNSAILTASGMVIGADTKSQETVNRKLPVLSAHNGGDTRAILTDRAGNIWKKTVLYLRRYDREGSRVTFEWKFKFEIKTLYIDENETIWVGLKAGGIYSLDLKNKELRPQLFSKDMFPDVSFIVKKTRDSLLIGTEHGLFQANVLTRKSALVPGTEGIFVKSIYCPNPAEIWFTGVEHGLSLFSGDKLVRFPLDRKQFLKFAHCIFEDKKGYLWIPTNNGLFRLYKKDLLTYAVTERSGGEQAEELAGETELFYQYFDKRNGFLINEFNGGCQPCAVRLPNGYLSLPSMKGLIQFIPEEVLPVVSSNTLLLDRIEYNGGSVFNINDTVLVPRTAERIRFILSTPHFGKTDVLNVSYKMIRGHSDPSAHAWVPIGGKDLIIYYSNLGAGNYTLYLKKSNGFGINNFTVEKIHVVVPPFWYETIWFRILTAVFFIGMVYFYVRYRLREIEKANAVLENRIARRTRELETSNAELQVARDQQSKQIRIMSRLLTSMSHDIQSPLNFIGRISPSVIRLVQSGDGVKAVEIVELIHSTANHMSANIADLLQYIKRYVYGRTMQFGVVNLAELIDAKLEIFRSMIESGQNQIVTDIPADLEVYTDRRMLSIVVSNLIDNAAKFTSEGIIRIRAFTDSDGDHLVFSNNGIPLSEAHLRLFSDQENDGISNIPSDVKVGLGLFLIREITEMLDIRLVVTQLDATKFELIFSSVDS